jgi:hypothetical protein
VAAAFVAAGAAAVIVVVVAADVGAVVVDAELNELTARSRTRPISICCSPGASVT